MKTLRPKPYMFPAIAAYHVYASLAMSRVPVALASRAGDGINKTTLEETPVECGMVCRKEIWSLAGIPVSDGGNPEVQITAYYAADGSYVGDKQVADNLIEKGIVPQRKRSDLNVASIGFSERDQKWAGWSHRALGLFGLGDTFHYANPFWSDDPTPSDLIIADLDMAKQSAINFSDDVA